MSTDLIRVGLRPPETYVVAVLKAFEENEKVTVTYVGLREKTAEEVFKLLENGGCSVGKLFKEQKEYDVYVYEFSGEKSKDGKKGFVEYFPKDDNIRIRGQLKPEFNKELKKLAMSDGIKTQGRMKFYYREVWKRGVF